MRNMCGEVGNQVPGSGSSPGSHGGVPATTGEDGVRNTDQGWTVFQITSTPATLWAVGSDSCGPDRARTRSSSQLSGRRARARARELDAAIATPWRRSGGRRRARQPRTRGTSPPLPSRTALACSGLCSRPWGRRLVPRRRCRRELPTASIATHDQSGRWDREIGRRNGVLLCSEVQT